jgi:hypothetical protein
MSAIRRHRAALDAQPGENQMRFEKGQSGNPAGRPPGSRNKATILGESIFQGEAEAIIRMAINTAKEGDVRAIRLCLWPLCGVQQTRIARSEHFGF